MDPYKSICKHIVTPLWAAWERSPYLTILDQLQKNQYSTLTEIEARQFSNLQQIVQHAYDNSKYYRTCFTKLRIKPNDIRSLADLGKLPILTKKDYRENAKSISVQDIRPYWTFFTSGSTGQPLTGFWDKYSTEFKRACKVHSEMIAGFGFGERVWCLYGNPHEEVSGFRRFRGHLRNRLLNRTSYLDLLRLNDIALENFVRKTKKAQPSIIWGHTHGLFTLANYLITKKINSFRPGAAISAGMPVHQFEREKIESSFKCKLFDRYGCEEFGVIASECQEHRGLHVNTEGLIVECVGKDGKTVAAGQRGQILITDLHNKGTPLIRYKLEDIIIFSDRRCDCGRHQPLISSIEGRSADFLIATSGMLVSGVSLTDHFMMGIDGIDQIQLVQEDVDYLVVNVVKNDFFTKNSRRSIGNKIAHFLGENMKYDIRFPGEIDPGPSGKFRFAICLVEHKGWH